MSARVSEANRHDIIDFLHQQNLETNLPIEHWTRATLDVDAITALLMRAEFRRNRKGYLAYIGKQRVGYCIVNYIHDNNELDLLYVSPVHRRKGIASELIKVSQANTVLVDPRNTEALALYTKLGLTIDLDE